MSRNEELLHNIMIFGIGVFGSKLIRFILIPLYTIYLTTEEFGISDLLVSTVSLISPLLMLGIGNGILRFIINQPQNRKSILKFSLVLSVISTLFLLILTPIWNRINIFNGFGYTFPILYLSSTIKNVFSQYCKAIEKNIAYSLDGVFSAVTLSLLCILFIVVCDLGVSGYLLAVILSESLSIIYFIFTCNIIKDLQDAVINWKLTLDLLKYSLPLMPNELGWWIIQMSDRYMVTYFCGGALNGIYSMAYKIPSIFNLLVSIFIQAFGITAIKECDLGCKIKDKYDGSYFEKIYKQYITVTFVTVVIVIWSSRFLAELILKYSFYNAWVYIPLLLCAYALGNLQAFYGSILAGIKQTKWSFYSTFGGAIINICLNLWLIPKYMAFGAAIATIISYFVVYLIRAIGILKNVRMNQYFLKVILSIIGILFLSGLYIVNRFLESFLLTVIIIWIYWNEVKIVGQKIISIYLKKY